MNEVRLSGILGEVEEHTSGNGVRLATARVRFNAHGDTVLLIAADARTRQLTAYGAGAHIRVIGRLASYNDNFAVLVDECGKWLGVKQSEKFNDDTKANRAVRELG